jgi:hypothetical protein
MSADQASMVPTCSNHPGVQTRLECSNCGTPICPRCMVSTPVGQKCPNCAKQSGRARGRPTTGLLLRALAAAAGAGAAGAVVVMLIGGRGGLLLAALYGFLVGAAAKRAAHGRRETLLGIAAAAGLVLGLAVVAIVFGVNPLSPGLALIYLIGGAVAYVRGAGIW